MNFFYKKFIILQQFLPVLTSAYHRFNLWSEAAAKECIRNFLLIPAPILNGTRDTPAFAWSVSEFSLSVLISSYFVEYSSDYCDDGRTNSRFTRIDGNKGA